MTHIGLKLEISRTILLKPLKLQELLKGRSFGGIVIYHADKEVFKLRTKFDWSFAFEDLPETVKFLLEK